MKTSRWLGGAALVALLGAAGWWFLLRSTEPEMSFRTAKIERGSLQAAVSATGTVTPVRQVQVSSQVSGQIKELFVDFNSEVKEGQLIARLDPETFEYRVRQSTADVEAARASVLTAQANVQSALAQVARANGDVGEAQRDERRKQDLLAQNFISPAELDTAKAKSASLSESLKVAQAQVDVARAQAQNALAIVRQRDAQLSQARVDLERTQIRSPVDGIVIKRSVEVGQTVAASLQAPELFIIARNLSDMQVEASIDEADISRVRDGQKVGFSIDAFPGRSFEGAVRQVRKAAVSAQNVVSYTVVVGFANPGSLMLPGMTANVRIITDTRESVLKVPNAALRVRIAGIEPEATAAPPAAAAVRSGAATGWSLWPRAMAQGAPGRPGALRERLVEGLQLDAAQQARLDAVLAGMQPDFMALGGFPEVQRAAAREQLMTELRGRVDAFLSPVQREAYVKLHAQATQAMQATQARAAASAAAPPPAATAVPPPARAAASVPGVVPSVPATSPRPPVAAVAPNAAAAPEVPASGPLSDFRKRLIEELGLSAAQTAQVDAVIAAQRPRFAELRNLAEGQRGKARDRILADMRALIAEQLTPEQQARYQKLQAEMAGRQNTRGRIYLLAEGSKPRAYDVRLGISDGVMTELIVAPNSADAGVLVEGANVITAV
ncbi:MAG TPA: efflux RND transporter periplasmic adaptor subunit, partial [Rubrivivax sp.]|nr:efflux RND transporter periplasmic adaptor subunit [Rubrivivax sp.]